MKMQNSYHLDKLSVVTAKHSTSESKRSSKLHSDKHKRSARNCDYEKNEIAKHCWAADHNFSEKKIVDRESKLIPRKIKETIYSSENSNQINKMSYMLPEIWFRNLWYVLSYLCMSNP